METHDVQPKPEERIMVVGEGPLSTGIVKALIRRGYDVRERADDGSRPAPLKVISLDPEVFRLHGLPMDRVVPLLSSPDYDRSPRHGWYLQFAGRRGRPPRY